MNKLTLIDKGMTPLEINNLIVADLDSRGLKDPNIRKNALKRVWEYIRVSGEFLVNDTIVLPPSKDDFKEKLARIKGYKLNSAESSVINMIYHYAGGSSCMPALQSPNTPQVPISHSATNRVLSHSVDSEIIENNLINGHFSGADELGDGSRIPARPGLYCIKLRGGVSFPKEFGTIREDGILYIGQASVSLRKRLWEQELNHRSAATFFRSVGAVLGYLPPRGSLANKKNKKNYEFSETDTQNIIEWMRVSLLVNFVDVNPIELNGMEKKLIGKYKPLLNIKHNPTASLALKAARKRCEELANEKS